MLIGSMKYANSVKIFTRVPWNFDQLDFFKQTQKGLRRYDLSTNFAWN